MPCDTLAEFRDLASYRKSFNGDLMMAKSRPQKFYFFESFPFETTKGPLLVLGKIDKTLLDELKKLGKTIKAKGLCSFKENVVKLTVTDGKIDDTQIKKALAHAQVRREATINTGDADRPEHKFKDKEKGPTLAEPSEKFVKARAELQKLMDKSDAQAWNDRDMKRASDAEDKITEVERFIRQVDAAITEADGPTRLLANQLNVQAKDPRAALYKAEFDATRKLLARQATLVKEAEKEVADLRRRLIPLKLLHKELALSGRVVELRVRSAMLKYSVHGDKTKTLHNTKDVLKALGADLLKLAAASKETASKFLNAELEKEAVARAVSIAQKECPWTEVQTDGRWGPLSTLVVFVGKPAASQGWNFVDKPDIAGDALKTLAAALDEFGDGKLSPNDLKGKIEKVMLELAEHVKGTKPKAPMIRSARVTLLREGGRWASVSHYPDRSAVPPGWNLRGKPVRLKADAPVVTAPACSAV